ncbi:phytanoyl-CoA dioxygenase family protein [Mangrovibacter sp. SLW1]
MINNPLLLECINGIFDEVSDSAWLSTAQVIEIQPEEKSQYLHRDCDNYPLFRRFGCKMPDIMCNCIVALSEYTEEMGATRAIPGSHIWDDFSYQPTQEETIAIVMEKGDAFLFSGKTIHGGGTNISNKPRRAMAMAFNAGWLVPEEALPLVIPIEMAKTLTPQAQQLMGFRSFHNTKLEGGSVWTVNFEELGKYLEKNT